MKALVFCFLIVCITQIYSYTLAKNNGLTIPTSNLRSRRQTPAQNKRIICYYGYWSIYREGPNKFTPEDIDPFLCTHILYGYAKPDREEGVVPNDKFDIEEKGWQRFISLKKVNPDLKLMLAIGGLLEGSTRFSRIASDPKLRQVFAKSAASVLRENGFDGIDMSWLYPGFSEGSSSSDKANYVLLLKDLKDELQNDFILSITIPGLIRLLDVGYDLPGILQYVDFFNVWAGAYHESTAPTVNHPSPLYPITNSPDDRENNVDATIRTVLSQGIPPEKINLLVALYGLYFVLEDPSRTEIGANTDDEAENNEWRGGLVYNELCQKIRKENWTVMRVNMTSMGPYAFKDKQWVAYDDEIMIRNKARYAVERKLGGFGYWTMDQDDFKGNCHLVNYPLIRAGREIMLNSPSISVSPINGALPLPFTTSTFPTRSMVNFTPFPTPIAQPDPPLLPPISPLSGGFNEDKLPRRNDREPKPFPDLVYYGDDKPFLNDINVDKDKIGGKGVTVYRSNRDIIFQNLKIWIFNHFYGPSKAQIS